MASETLIEAGDDLVPTYTEAEERQLATQLSKLHLAIEHGDHLDRAFDLGYLCELHHGLFDGVRSHAGQHRRAGWGSEHKIFGPNRSVHRDVVERELRQCFERVGRSVRSVDDNADDPGRDQAALQIAVWAHAEIVRVHPFEDGNGRTSRLALDALLVRMDLAPIPLDEAKQTYCDCLNLYFADHDIQPLLSLYARLAYEQLGSTDRR